MVATVGQGGVTPGGDHAFLGEEAVEGVTQGGEERRVQGPVAELRLTHALQQVWIQTERERVRGEQLSEQDIYISLHIIVITFRIFNT